MFGGDATVRNALRIERDYLVKLSVAFNFLLELLDGVKQVFQQVALTTSFVNRRSRASCDACRKIDQCFKLPDLPVACAECRQCELFVLKRINRRA
ncbi:hypothetical protein OI25_2186 [Paraburkholderia fungorum]|uniref:Transcriptional activator FlhC n=1 Tax=Paraburkholderia fungorum TaxID=134537 RepID=A0AAU8SUW9_9BURK|nr:hypothetical protein OI25_2186 [Paraburkholderia fungorum]